MTTLTENLRRRWWMAETNAAQADILPQDPNDPTRHLLDQLVANARAAGAADVLAGADARMEQSRDIRLQRVATIREQIEMELAHADIDGTLVHAKSCAGSGFDDCDCGVYAEATAAVEELIRTGKITFRAVDTLG